MRLLTFAFATLGLLATSAAIADGSTPTSLGAALDTTFSQLKLGQIGNFRIIWGPPDENIAAAIAKATPSAQAPSLLDAIQAAKTSATAPANPFTNGGNTSSSTPDPATVSQIAKGSAGQTCITTLTIGNTGAYQDNPLCAPASTREQVRTEILQQAGWQLSGSSNNIDQAISPDGLGVQFFYTPSGITRQVLVLLNGAQ